MGENTKRVCIVLLFLLCTSFFTLKTTKASPEETGIKNLSSDLNFYQANVLYEIKSGFYICDFTLRTIGDANTEQGNMNGSFVILNSNISNFKLKLNAMPVEPDFYTINTVGNLTICNYTIVLGLSQGDHYHLSGNFQGTYIKNESNYLTYNLGINWEQQIAAHNTTIRIDERMHNVHSVEPEMPHLYEFPSPYFKDLKWSHSEVTGSYTNLTVIPRIISDFYIEIDQTTWDCCIEEIKLITLYNGGEIPIHGWVIPPSWIVCNTTNFTINPSQRLNLQFTIRSEASLGMKGNIEIIFTEFPYNTLSISVHIVRGVAPLITGVQFVLITIILLILISTIIGLSYYYQKAIRSFYIGFKNRKKHIESSMSQKIIGTPDESFKEFSSEVIWDSIQFRWENILAEKELKVIKILFHNGSMNQQTIANSIEVSKMSMSRIISRLEDKKLLVRERSGISNMIKLNEERL